MFLSAFHSVENLHTPTSQKPSINFIYLEPIGLQSLLCIRIIKMNPFTTDHCMHLLFILILISSNFVHSEKYENTTNCVYRTISNVESFEFICEPNKSRREFFDNSNSIYCQAYDHYYYKERRHEINFKDCYIKSLPTIFKWYKAVRKLNVSDVGLEGLRSRNFDYAENLMTLIASHNEITEIPSSLFADSKKIANLDFSFNKINHIDPLAFETENSLTSINLSNNLIREMDNRTFLMLNQLENIDLSQNLIECISSGLFLETVKLRELKLHVNQLKVIQCEDFAKLIKLEYLTFSKNRLQELDVSCISSEKPFTLDVTKNALSRLTLSENLAEMHAGENEINLVFVNASLDNLTVFEVPGNHIENIIETIGHLGPSLKSLVISDSPIGKLNVSTFAKFENLEHLGLANTNLSNIQYGTFHHQQKLRALDLSDNNLMKINFGILQWNSEHLQSLYLDGNMLIDLTNLTKANFPSLEFLSIDRNHFDCDYLSKIQRILKNDGITFTTNANLVEDIWNSQTHINGITCYHGNVRSNLDTVEDVSTETDKLRGNYRTVDNAADLASLRKVEYLLICIIIMLVCLVVVSITKNFVTATQKRRFFHWSRTDSVHYRSEADNQSFA